MTALSANRNTPEIAGGNRKGPLGANQTIFQGALLMRNASGHLIEGAVATGSIGAGVAAEPMTSTTAGLTEIEYRTGIFRFGNSASSDLIAADDVGKLCYIVDDQTVALTDGSAARSPAGYIEGVDDAGVWVRIDPALTHAGFNAIAA